jgi:hypothetical protein
MITPNTQQVGEEERSGHHPDEPKKSALWGGFFNGQ